MGCVCGNGMVAVTYNTALDATKNKTQTHQHKKSNYEYKS